ncbi:MAG: OmpA family protein [Spirochaetia bacterium]|nr:OmpA family protein [Spirochaetia bacterium]
MKLNRVINSILLFYFITPVNGQNLNTLESLGENINSEYDEIAPIYSSDGSTLYFCRGGHPQNTGYFQMKDDQDIWMSRKTKFGTWSTAVQINAPFNTIHYDFPIGTSADGNTLYLGNVYEKDGIVVKGVSKSRFINGKWTFPVPLEIRNFYTEGPLVNYHMGSDEKTLILNLKRNDSMGGMDLYVSTLQSDGTWSAPQNMGPSINTSYNEITPHLASDMQTLYFASDKYDGYGGFDMYYSRKLDGTWVNWSAPENLGPLINTEKNDIHYIISPDRKYAIFSKDTENNRKDLFLTNLPDRLKPGRIELIEGVVKTSEEFPIEAVIYYENLKTGKILGRTTSDEKGKFKIALPVGKKYLLRAEKRNFFSVSESVDLINSPKKQKLNLILKTMKAGMNIALRNIFFDYNSSVVKSESFSELNRLYEMLIENQSIKIEIGGHTDNSGSAEYNLKLSEMRAKAVYDFLISKGISEDRITYIGYGSRQPAASNATEAGKFKNRRVEFKIVELE